jgi:hypothetical protein
MSIYTYKTHEALCEIFNIEYYEDPRLSDQTLHFEEKKLLDQQNNSKNIAENFSKKLMSLLSKEEKRERTKCANLRKTGYKESQKSRNIKSIAQKTRWEQASKEERKEHGKISRMGISEEGKIKSLTALKNSISPARTPGIKKQKAKCPHCNKIGGLPIMSRYHFDKCKEKIN